MTLEQRVDPFRKLLQEKLERISKITSEEIDEVHRKPRTRPFIMGYSTSSTTMHRTMADYLPLKSYQEQFVQRLGEED